MHGPLSIAVPGHVDGLALARRTFGTKSFGEVSAARDRTRRTGHGGRLVSDAEERRPWHASLSRYPDHAACLAAATAMPPVTPAGAPLERLKLTGLADTLRRSPKTGRRDFYEGEVARDRKRHRRNGRHARRRRSEEFHARIVAPLEVDYGGARVALAGGLTGGQSMAGVLTALAADNRSRKPASPRADAFVAYAQTLRDAYAERLTNHGRRERSSRVRGCTSHFNVIDREGNMVAVTQTLLSVYGSRMVLPTQRRADEQRHQLVRHAPRFAELSRARPNGRSPICAR